MPRIPIATLLASLTMSAGLAACGLLYQAHTEVRTSHMLKRLRTGESTLDVHNDWGEPDIRTYFSAHSQTWSYAERPNTNDVTASLLYTAPKAGDKGRFLDLKFEDGRLSSWAEADHMMPEKEGSGFSYGVGGVPPLSGPNY